MKIDLFCRILSLAALAWILYHGIFPARREAAIPVRSSDENSPDHPAH